MPNMKSAKKHMITDEKSRIRNKSRRTAMKTAEKKFRTAVESSDAAQAKELMVTAFKTLDKAVKYGTIHKNKANRKKAQFQKNLANIK
jgi:small subunit ribosomal protein S20